MLQRQNVNTQINSCFTPATDLHIGTFVLCPNFTTQKGISKKLQPLRKRIYQIIENSAEVTYKLIDTNKKEIIQHRNKLLPYYPKEYALRELTQLYSFTGLKTVQINLGIKLNHHTDKQMSSKTDKKKEFNHQTSPKQKNTNISKRKKKEKNDRKNPTTRSKRKT